MQPISEKVRLYVTRVSSSGRLLLIRFRGRGLLPAVALHSLVDRTSYKAVDTLSVGLCMGFYLIPAAFFNPHFDFIIIFFHVFCDSFLLCFSCCGQRNGEMNMDYKKEIVNMLEKIENDESLKLIYYFVSSAEEEENNQRK